MGATGRAHASSPEEADASPPGAWAPGAPAPWPPPPGGDDSFRYLEPQVAHPWRAAAWIGLELSLHMADYLLTARPPGPIYDTVYTPWDKLAHGAVSYDANTYRTNFLGHPFMGASMYQLARGNREPAWLASLYALGGSTTWELIEFQEKASINDLVVTPVAGVALGEALFQMAAHLDRSPPSVARTVLAWLAAPWKKVADAVDGARLARGAPADRLESRASAGAASTDGVEGRRGELRASAGWRLWRDADYGAPGHHTSAWLDGQATGLWVSAAAGASGVTDARLSSSALLASLYARSIGPSGRGADLVAGVGAGFDLGGHDWTRAGPFDLAGTVDVPRATLQARWLDGPLRLTARLDAALRFGGSRSFALDGDPGSVPFDTLPSVQQQNGYHFGVGGMLQPALELAWARPRSRPLAAPNSWTGSPTQIRPRATTPARSWRSSGVRRPGAWPGASWTGSRWRPTPAGASAGAAPGPPRGPPASAPGGWPSRPSLDGAARPDRAGDAVTATWSCPPPAASRCRRARRGASRAVRGAAAPARRGRPAPGASSTRAPSERRPGAAGRATRRARTGTSPSSGAGSGPAFRSQAHRRRRRR